MSENGEENINDIREKIIQECTCVSQIFFNITNYLKEFQQLKEEYLKEIYGKIGLSQNSYSNSSETKNMGIRTEEIKINKNILYKNNKNNKKKNNINQKEINENHIVKINKNQLKVKSIFEEDININENKNNIINNNNIENNNNSSSLFNIFNEIREDVLNKPEVIKKKEKKRGRKSKKKNNKNNKIKEKKEKKKKKRKKKK